MKRVLRFFTGLFGWLFTLICSGIIIGCIAALLLLHHYTKDLPDYTALAKYDPPTVTRLYAADGKLLAEYATEKRVYMPLSAIPKRVIFAFLSAEDKNFYTHTGIDYRGIARALYTNILQYGSGGSLVGGSTITQQVVKNFLLTNEQSLERKIKEAVLALRITSTYSKDRILELYLNEIYLGGRSYGIAAAALNYFNKSLDEITLSEAAFLAALPKAPSYYDPRKHYDAALMRRNWVLKRMADDGHISAEEMQQAQNTPILLRQRDKDEIADADFFAEEVRRWLAEHYGEAAVKEAGLVVKTTLNPELQAMADHALRATLTAYDRKRGYRGALAHVEGMDKWQAELAKLGDKKRLLVEDQQLAVVLDLSDKAATIGLKDGSKGTVPVASLKWTRRVMDDGSLGAETKKPADIFSVGDVIIAQPVKEAADKDDSKDSKKKVEKKKKELPVWELEQVPLINGALVAMDPHTGRVLAMSGGYSGKISDFNRASQAYRQPGSAFKPFVFTAAFENGFTPSTPILDAPIEITQGADKAPWRPSNYGGDFMGTTTLRRGLEKSRNTMTVRMAQALGIERILEIGKRFGIYNDPPRNMSIVLGASETTLLKLANAYAMLANGGRRVEPSLIERVDDRHGRILYRRDNRQCPECVVEHMDMNAQPPSLADMRERIIDRRVAYQITSVLQGVVERGTATRARVLNRPVGGKTGTTNDSRDAWFMGFTPNLVVGVYIGFDTPRSLGARETGSSVALPAFIDFVQTALKDTPPEPFPIPSGLELMRVDLDTGKPLESWEVAHVKDAIWEAFIRRDQPLFKPESALALGKVPPEAHAFLMDEESQLDIFGNPATPLPWQQPARINPLTGLPQALPQNLPQTAPPDSAFPYPPTRRHPFVAPAPTTPPVPPEPPRPAPIIGQPTTPQGGTGGLY